MPEFRHERLGPRIGVRLENQNDFIIIHIPGRFQGGFNFRRVVCVIVNYRKQLCATLDFESPLRASELVQSADHVLQADL